MAEGWFKVSPATLSSGILQPAVPTPSPEPTLLLLHGTFSNAVAAFKDLASNDFFRQVAPRYAERIYVFNHFTLSKTPEDNAKDLLSALGERAGTFDVITHSRGGLVLRNLVERRDLLGPAARRFQLGRAVLVASPNSGTPLATPMRWQETVGWIANLVEYFPQNPLTLPAEWVSEAVGMAGAPRGWQWASLPWMQPANRSLTFSSRRALRRRPTRRWFRISLLTINSCCGCSTSASMLSSEGQTISWCLPRADGRSIQMGAPRQLRT